MSIEIFVKGPIDTRIGTEIFINIPDRVVAMPPLRVHPLSNGKDSKSGLQSGVWCSSH